MASGKAVVTSQTGPGPELIEDGVSGLLCDPHSPASIADKVIRLLKDASLRRRLGSQARLRVVQQFSTGALVERNEAFYSRCVQESKYQPAEPVRNLGKVTYGQLIFNNREG
jgi:glycosyltransferase involved in cell wall biosynthesis